MQLIPGYELIQQIGEGGMALVYKGVQVSLQRPVAIKILQKKLLNHSTVLERFQRESLIIARLNHPNIIHVIDRGVTDEGMPYFVMEYVEGTDLETVIREGNLDVNRKVDLVIQICKALSYAHKNGVIHRDIKPSNVLIDQEGNARMLDFGIAQIYSKDSGMDTRHTKAGSIMGSPEYMSPEQRNSADQVTALSDLYSLGALMYELFTQVKPIGRLKAPAEINPGIPDALQEIILTCMEPNPSDRPVSADAVKDSLLKLFRGAHLDSAQKKRATQEMSSIRQKFALLDVIKEEQNSSVYLYEDKASKNLMVIKKRPGDSQGYMQAKLLTSLKHKNIINILGTSKDEHVFIIVMEYLSGGSLKDRMAKPYQLYEFMTLTRQICQGLAFAHRNRIFHGNLRPSNILFSDQGVAKITDFGLDEHYSPPLEMINWYNPDNEPASMQADIRAAGIIFFQMLSGTLPQWKGGSLDLPPIFSRIPPALKTVIIRMVTPDLNRRYNHMDEVLSDIDNIMQEIGKTEPPRESAYAGKKTVQKASGRGGSKKFKTWIWVGLSLTSLAALLAYLIFSGQLSGLLYKLTQFWQ